MPYAPLSLLVALLLQSTLIFVTALLKTATGLQPESLIYPTCCLILIASVWFIASWVWITRQLFHPYVIFLVSAILFNAGQALLEVFHANRLGILRGSFSGATIADTLLFVLLSLAAFHFGALLCLTASNVLTTSKQRLARRSRPSRLVRTTQRPVMPSFRSQSDAIDAPLDTAPGAIGVGWGLTAFAFLPFVYVFIKSLQVVLSRGYQGLFQGEQETSVAAAPDVVGGFIVPAAIFLLAGSADKQSSIRRPWIRNVAIGLMVLYIMSRFFLGERRKVATAVAGILWLWHARVAKLPTLLLLGLSLALAILFPLVASTRNSAAQQGFDAIQAQLYGVNNPIFATLSEMGGTMMTVAATMELVPSARPFQMGADYGYALLTLFPNLFWKVHPTIERGLAGNWLTWAIDPEFAARGGGYGYSFIAEAYLNFGWVGGPGMLGLIGFAYTALTLWSVNSRSAARMALIGTFTCYFPFFARSEAALHVRALVWYTVFPYWGAVYLSKRLMQQKNRLQQRLNTKLRSCK
jgi:hypothetical protein